MSQETKIPMKLDLLSALNKKAPENKTKVSVLLIIFHKGRK
mgnify:CR=1 FL=1